MEGARRSSTHFICFQLKLESVERIMKYSVIGLSKIFFHPADPRGITCWTFYLAH